MLPGELEADQSDVAIVELLVVACLLAVNVLHHQSFYQVLGKDFVLEEDILVDLILRVLGLVFVGEGGWDHVEDHLQGFHPQVGVLHCLVKHKGTVES